MLSSEENGPGDAAGIFALEKKGFCLAVLEAEDLAVTTDVKLALLDTLSAERLQLSSFYLLRLWCFSCSSECACKGCIRGGGSKQFVPFQGRSSHQRRYRRRYAS
jgi:hypothetical protein